MHDAVAVTTPSTQRKKWKAITAGILGTLFTAGIIWCSPGFRRYVKKQWEAGKEEERYKEKLLNNDFRVTSSLKLYKDSFGDQFEQDVLALGEEERWMDGGGGVGQAISDYYGEGGKAQTTVVGFEKPDQLPDNDHITNNPKFNYVSGKYFSNTTDEDLEIGNKGQMSVITDYNGILSYTDTLSEDIQKYLDKLKTGGKLYAYFQPPDILEGNERITPLAWLQKGRGYAVENVKEKGKEKRDPTVYTITKTHDKPVVPPLKKEVFKFEEAANIPRRVFRLS